MRRRLVLLEAAFLVFSALGNKALAQNIVLNIPPNAHSCTLTMAMSPGHNDDSFHQLDLECDPKFFTVLYAHTSNSKEEGTKSYLRLGKLNSIYSSNLLQSGWHYDEKLTKAANQKRGLYLGVGQGTVMTQVYSR